MQLNLGLYTVLCYVAFNRAWTRGYRQEEMVIVDLSHSMIFTSPLKTGSNSSEILLSDFTKDPTCIVSLPLPTSWILIDFGFQISGISQIRLVSDYYLENAYEFLDDIDVGLAEYLPYSIVQNSNFSDSRYIKLCGNTGTVSKDTSNVVVDCISRLNVRWVLIKRKGPLNLCRVQILKTSVKPECFQRLKIQDSFYEKAKSKLDVFRSNRRSTFLVCLQNCDTEFKCNAVAFIPLKNREGICQLLRFREYFAESICDESCSLMINRCQLGERVKLRKTDKGHIFRISSIKSNFYAVSIELNGRIQCNANKCGYISLILSDDKGISYECGTVDSLFYRIFVNTVLICENPVRNPQVLIVKNKENVTQAIYEFTSINIRLVLENSLPLNYIKIRNFLRMTTVSSSSTFSTLESTTVESKTFAPILSNNANEITSPHYKEKNTSRQRNVYSNLRNNQNDLSSTSESSLKERISGLFTKSNGVIILKETINYTRSKKYNTTVTHIVFSTQKKESKFNQHDHTSNRSRKQKNTSHHWIKKNNLKTLIETSVTKSFQKVLISLNPYQTQKTLQTTNRIFLSIDKFNKSSTELFDNETTFSLKTITPTNNYVQFVWLIVLAFGSILVFVTAIVVLISYIEVKRKKKRWDLPAGGLCPSNHDSVSITSHSSVHMSILMQTN